MLHDLLCKLFGLDPHHYCETCEVLRQQLANSERERRELLAKILDRDKPDPVPQTVEEHIPITPSFTPWRVRQQMLESEDHKKAQLMKERAKEIHELEKELGVDKLATSIDDLTG